MTDCTLKIFGALIALSALSICVGYTVGTFAALMHVEFGGAENFENLQFVYSLVSTIAGFGIGLYTIYHGYD